MFSPVHRSMKARRVDVSHKSGRGGRDPNGELTGTIFKLLMASHILILSPSSYVPAAASPATVKYYTT